MSRNNSWFGEATRRFFATPRSLQQENVRFQQEISTLQTKVQTLETAMKDKTPQIAIQEEQVALVEAQSALDLERKRTECLSSEVHQLKKQLRAAQLKSTECQQDTTETPTEVSLAPPQDAPSLGAKADGDTVALRTDMELGVTLSHTATPVMAGATVGPTASTGPLSSSDQSAKDTDGTVLLAAASVLMGPPSITTPTAGVIAQEPAADHLEEDAIAPLATPQAPSTAATTSGASLKSEESFVATTDVPSLSQPGPPSGGQHRFVKTRIPTFLSMSIRIPRYSSLGSSDESSSIVKQVPWSSGDRGETVAFVANAAVPSLSDVPTLSPFLGPSLPEENTLDLHQKELYEDEQEGDGEKEADKDAGEDCSFDGSDYFEYLLALNAADNAKNAANENVYKEEQRSDEQEVQASDEAEDASVPSLHRPVAESGVEEAAAPPAQNVYKEQQRSDEQEEQAPDEAEDASVPSLHRPVAESGVEEGAAPPAQIVRRSARLAERYSYGRYLGCRAAKEFHGIVCNGTVVAVPSAATSSWFRIKYDDSDEEEYTKEELQDCLDLYESMNPDE